MRRFIITFGSAALSLALAGLILLHGGASWRIPDERIYPSAKEMRSEESALCDGTDILNGEQLGSAPGEPIVTCSHDIGAAKNIYVWGDSHARHLLAGLIEAYPDHNIRILYFTSCLAQSGSGGYVYDYEGREALKQGCLARNTRARAFFEDAEPAAVILHQFFGYDGQFSPEWYAATEELIALLERAGHRVAILGGVPRPGVALAVCLAVPPLISDALLQRRCVGDPSVSQVIVARNIELSKRFPAHFVNVNGFFCPDSQHCQATRGATLLFRDKHHLTIEGSRKLIAYVRPQLSAIFDK